MPKLITTPFALNGQKNEITVNTPETDNSATYDIGFPPITSLPIASGGKPPKGADFNGLFYDITDNIAYLTLGNAYVFNAGLSYPLNARINRNDGVRVRSTVANNTTNPNTSMTGWEIDNLSPSQNLSELTNKATARTNLDVYSKAETDVIAGTPNATEVVAGKAKIATTAIAQEGEDDTAFLTAKKLRDALNASGEAPISAFRAWAVFSATSGGVTISNALNVSSIIRTATGKYTINFITSMPTSSYVLVGSCSRAALNSTNSVAIDAGVTPTTGSISIFVNNASSGIDLDYISIGVIC